MSLHDRFDNSSHPGFYRAVDPRSARRQLHVSFGVMTVLALAILGSAAVIRPATGFDSQAQRASISASAAVSHHNMNATLPSTVTGG